MMKARFVIEWLQSLDPDELVGIGEDGLAIVAEDDRDVYLEVGGLPEED